MKEDTLEQISLNSEDESYKLDAQIETYLKKYFQIEVDGKAKEWIFIGKEYEKEAIWCYLEVKKIRKFEEIKITNELIIPTYEEQKNLVHINKQGLKRSLLFQKDNTIKTAKF